MVAPSHAEFAKHAETGPREAKRRKSRQRDPSRGPGVRRKQWTIRVRASGSGESPFMPAPPFVTMVLACPIRDKYNPPPRGGSRHFFKVCREVCDCRVFWRRPAWPAKIAPAKRCQSSVKMSP